MHVRTNRVGSSPRKLLLLSTLILLAVAVRPTLQQTASTNEFEVIKNFMSKKNNSTSTSVSKSGEQILPEEEPVGQVNLTKKLPQAIIIGAKKCGTRALLKFIGAHYNVSAAGAETHFFDRFYHMGYDWYRDQMPLSNDHQITIEKTPKYLIDKRVPERVYNMNPKMKLIVVLRDPVTRAISEYVQAQLKRQTYKLGAHPSQLAAAYNANSTALRRLLKHGVRMMNDSQRFQQMLYDKRFKNKTIRREWPIVRNGIYIEHLQNWLDYFPLEQFQFVNGEELIRDPSVELKRVQEFLNLKPIIDKRHFVRNKRKGFACIYKPLDTKQVRCLSDQKGRPHPVIDQHVLDDLHEFYKPYNKMLFELINQQSSPWWPI